MSDIENQAYEIGYCNGADDCDAGRTMLWFAAPTDEPEDKAWYLGYLDGYYENGKWIPV